MNSNHQSAPANEKLRIRLDDFYQCAEDALTRLYTTDGYKELCIALCKEMDELIAALTLLDEQYQEELPLDSEEPKNVVWETEEDKMLDLAEQLLKHPSGKDSESPQALYNRMTEAANLMESIDQKLFPEGDPDIFASYSKRELLEYTKFKWNKARRELRPSIVSATLVHQNESFQSQLKDCQERLHEKSAYILNEDNSVIFHEGLGRYIWQMRHTLNASSSVDEMLCLVKSVEFFSGKLQSKLTFLERETSPSEEVDEAIRLENLRQETLQNQHEKMAFRLCRCEQYLHKDYSTSWLRKMITDMINSEHSAVVCEKMKNRKLLKFIHQVVGVLSNNDIFVDCTNGQLVTAVGFGTEKPNRASRIDYIRHMVDDVPEIQEWMVNYIANYKEEQKRQQAQG